MERIGLGRVFRCDRSGSRPTHADARTRAADAIRPWRDRRGAAAVEFALMAPILLLLFTGMVEYGTYIQQGMTVASATRAGVQYSLHSHANAEDSAAIESIVRSELGSPASLTIAVEESSRCPDGTSVAANQTCPGYGRPQVFVTVRATLPFSSLMLGMVSLAGETITKEATVRIR